MQRYEQPLLRRACRLRAHLSAAEVEEGALFPRADLNQHKMDVYIFFFPSPLLQGLALTSICGLVPTSS